jgi:hypothetical protein
VIDILVAFDYTFANHAVAGPEAGHGLADLDHLARPFVARYHRIGDWNDVVAAIELVV